VVNVGHARPTIEPFNYIHEVICGCSFVLKRQLIIGFIEPCCAGQRKNKETKASPFDVDATLVIDPAFV
jgi:hypothetical protein